MYIYFVFLGGWASVGTPTICYDDFPDEKFPTVNSDCVPMNSDHVLMNVDSLPRVDDYDSDYLPNNSDNVVVHFRY